MTKQFEIDNVGKHHTAFFIGLFVTFVALVPVSIVLSVLTGWWW